MALMYFKSLLLNSRPSPHKRAEAMITKNMRSKYTEVLTENKSRKRYRKAANIPV